MVLSAAERQRRCREKRKQDPEKLAEVKRKDLARYHAHKKLVKDMTPREHRQMKRKWQVRNKKRREIQKSLKNILMYTPTSTPVPSSPRSLPLSPRSRSLTPASSTTRERGRGKVRRDRSKIYRQNLKLQEQLKELQKKIRKYKKRLQRQKSKEKNITKTRKSQQDKIVSADEEKIKYCILTNAIKERYKNIKDFKTRHCFKTILEDRAINRSGLKLKLFQETLGIKRKSKKYTLRPRIISLISKIHSFYLRDDVSRATAGKNETVTLHKKKMQKRILLDTRKNLYISFRKENPDVKCHYSYFAKHKPFYVVPARIDGRETCMCKLHANITFMKFVLYKNKVIKTNDMNLIISQTVCDVNSITCMKGKCTECETKKLYYCNMIDQEKLVELVQWVRKADIIEKNGKKIKISKNIKRTEQVTITILIKKFEENLTVFKSHVFNIRNQYKSYRQCITGLTETEIALHIDFSENYTCKYHEEIQSVHFSRNQVTLHTAVMYYLTSTSDKRITSFCTVSSDLNHGPAAIWAHLHLVLDWVQKELPLIKTVHFFSDGPATQYKQKNNFYLLATRFFEQYRFESLTWNFFESGHGKGAADGIGGSIKRLADNFVASGHDITDAFEFYEALKDRSKIKVFLVEKDDIAQILVEIPTEIIPLKGTMDVHQLMSQEPGVLSYRSLSCFCHKFCDCYNLKTYCPLPERVIEVNESPTSDLNEPLTDLTNIIRAPTKRFYETVYTSTSEDEDDQPLVTLKEPKHHKPGTSYDISKDNIHPLLIKNGTHLLVKVLSTSKVDYIYLGVAKSCVDEDGDVRVMFYKTVDDTGKIFKLVKSDVSDVMFENLIKIIPSPKEVKRGKRVFYEFEKPIEVFEK
nr:uncharacterized protein LOC128679821 [Plodia interpunctella]